MKIAFVYDVPYPWHKGGIEHIMAIEAEELAKEHEVHFFTLKWPGMQSEFVHNGVRYHAYGDASETNVYRHGRRSVREAVVFSLYAMNIFRYKFDAIITDEFPVLHLLGIRTYRLARRCKLVVRFDEVWDRRYWVDYLGPVLGRIAGWYSDILIKSNSARYIADFGRIADTLKERGIPAGSILVFAPILDRKELEAKHAGGTAREKVVIFSGRFIKEKRIDKWLRIMSDIIKMDSSVKGLIIGDGVEKKSIERDIRGLSLERNVSVAGFYKDKARLYDKLAGSSLLLHMSEREGLSIITLESLAVGTPVLIPEGSPISDEAKSMCVVVPEKDMAKKALEIIRSRDKGRYIRNKENLEAFYIQDVGRFYKKLLR